MTFHRAGDLQLWRRLELFNRLGAETCRNVTPKSGAQTPSLRAEGEAIQRPQDTVSGPGSPRPFGARDDERMIASCRSPDRLRSRGARSKAMPSPGANPAFSIRCGAIFGRLARIGQKAPPALPYGRMTLRRNRSRATVPTSCVRKRPEPIPFPGANPVFSKAYGAISGRLVSPNGKAAASESWSGKGVRGRFFPRPSASLLRLRRSLLLFCNLVLFCNLHAFPRYGATLALLPADSFGCGFPDRPK